MRSSKSRSRSKSNRPRSIGNIINRVFESSGPEGKVRGTPQQIIEKYAIHARDAQLSNDRVSAENFLQHAEHYTRMLAEAQRELAAEQDQRQQSHGGNGGGTYPGNGTNGNGGNGNGNGGGYAAQPPVQQGSNGPYNRDRPQRDDRNDANRDQRQDRRADPRDEPSEAGPRPGGMMDFIDTLDESALVETPESRPQRDRAPRPEGQDRRPEGQERRRDDRRPRGDQPRPEARSDARSDTRPDQPSEQQGTARPEPAPPAAELPQASEPSEAAPRRARAPRKPKAAPDGAKPDAADQD